MYGLAADTGKSIHFLYLLLHAKVFCKPAHLTQLQMLFRLFVIFFCEDSSLLAPKQLFKKLEQAHPFSTPAPSYPTGYCMLHDFVVGKSWINLSCGLS